MADFNTCVRKYAGITGYPIDTAEMLLRIDLEDGGMDLVERRVSEHLQNKRLHKCAEELWAVGYDPMDALELLHDALVSGGIQSMEFLRVRMAREKT